MKHTLPTLVCLVMAGSAAHAQSNVTVYGAIDLGIVKQNDGSTPMNGGNTVANTELRQSSPSRIGVRAEDDLGGGLKVKMRLEQRFFPDNGASNPGVYAPAQYAQSWLALEGSFGEIRLGRDFSPYLYIALAADPFDDGTVARVGLETSYGVYYANAGPRMNNAIMYKSKSLGGLTFDVAASPGEGIYGDENYGFNVQYMSGPLYAGLGMERKATIDQEGMIGTVGYDFGPLRATFSYARSSMRDTMKGTSYSTSVTVPMGNGGTLRAQLSRVNYETVGFPETPYTKFGVGYERFLSKRTSVYTNLGTAKLGEMSRTTAVDLGFRRRF